MSNDQEGGNPATAVAEPVSPQTQNGQAAPVTSGTSDQNGQAATQAQSAPAEESFSSIDPETLPPELKAVYKSLQADYTKKVQPVAELRKKAEAYDKVSQDQRFIDYWKGLNRSQKADYKEQKAEVERKLGEKISDEDFQKSFESKDAYLSMQERIAQHVLEKAQKKIDELEKFKTVTESSNIVESFATELGPDNKPLRPDFYSLDEDGLITGFLQVYAKPGAPAEEQRATLDQAYKWSKATTQKYYEKGKAEALQIIEKKVASSSQPPTQAAKGAYTGAPPKNLSVKEAMELAKKGIRVPRDD